MTRVGGARATHASGTRWISKAGTHSRRKSKREGGKGGALEKWVARRKILDTTRRKEAHTHGLIFYTENIEREGGVVQTAKTERLMNRRYLAWGRDPPSTASPKGGRKKGGLLLSDH